MKGGHPSCEKVVKADLVFTHLHQATALTLSQLTPCRRFHPEAWLQIVASQVPNRSLAKEETQGIFLLLIQVPETGARRQTTLLSSQLVESSHCAALKHLRSSDDQPGKKCKLQLFSVHTYTHTHACILNVKIQIG